MIFLFISIALILGLTLTRGIVALNIVFSVLYFLYIIYRFGIKKSSIFILIFGIGLTFSLIKIENNPNDNIYKGLVVEVHQNYYIFSSKYEKFYVYEENTNKECGDYLTISGYSKDNNFTNYESQFDFNEYLNNKGIRRTLVALNVEYQFRNPIRINNRKNEFLSNFDNETASLIDAFLFARKDYNSSSIALADSLNIASLLAMNGMYLYVIMSFLEFFLLYFFKKRTTELLSIVILLPYLLFSYTKFGIVKVFFIRIFRYINNYFLNNKFDYLSILSISFIFFLVIDFHLIYQQAFYLGFLISFVLIFIRTYSKKVKKQLLPFIVIVTISILLFPISSNNSHEFHFFSHIIQLIITPFHFIFAVFSLLNFYFILLPKLMNFLAKIIVIMYKYLDFIDISVPISYFEMYLRYLYYLILLLSFIFYEYRFKKKFFISISLLISMVLLNIVPIRNIYENAVYFVNVGQGDCIVIKNKNHAVMIDTGGNAKFDMAKETLIPFLNKNLIYKLDALIISHNDFDHNGAMNSLIDLYQVNNVLDSKDQFPYQVGDLYFENFNLLEGVSDNDSSLVLKLEFVNKTFLFTGDASKSVEQFLIDENFNIDCDVLKIGHHGSNTSTSEQFLKACSPELAIISVGRNNMYHHPNIEVIELLNKYHIQIRRTDIEGTITIK